MSAFSVSTTSFIGFLVAKRWVLAAFMLVLTGASTVGILRIGFDTSLQALLTRSDPYLDQYDLFNAEFPQALDINIVFVPPANSDAFDPLVLAAIAELQEDYRQLPNAQRASTLLNYYSPQRQQRLFQRPFTNYSEEEIAELKEQALDDRLLVNSLLAPDLSLAFANVFFDPEQFSNGQRLELADAALAFRDSLRESHPAIDIHFSSDVLLEQSSRQAMIDDLSNLLPIVILICVLVICFCFRSVLMGSAILAHALLSVALTLGALGFLNFSFNSISIIAPLVVVIIAVANSVHIISIYKQGLQAGMDRLAAMSHSLTYNLRPITLAIITTAIGFSSLNLCSSPAIQDFGRIVAIGIGFAYVLTLFALPAMLIVTTRQVGSSDSDTYLQRLMGRIVSMSERFDRRIFISCSAIAIGTLFLLPLNETDFNRMDFISGNSDIRDYYDVVSEVINRGPQLSYGVNSGTVDGAIEPAFLDNLANYVDWINSLPEVESAASIVDLVKTINQVQNQNDPAQFAIPADIDTVAAHLNGYETVQSEDFPLLSFINDDFSMVTLIVNAEPMSNQALINLDAKLTTEFANFFASSPNDTAAELVHGSGLLLFARMDELVTVELLQGYSLSLFLITLCLVVGLRSLYFGVLSVIPNLLPATIVFGFWALFVGQLDPFVMMLFSISIGLVVDDTVHILSHYLEGRQQGLPQSSAIRKSITVAGPALTITTVVLALGTTILIGANTLYFQQSAKLLVPIVLLALILDLFYLPTILKRFDRA